MFFNFLLGRGMAAAEDEETVGGEIPQDAAAAAANGDAAARGDGYDDDEDEAGNGSTGTAVRLEDVLLQLTEEEREEDAALQASFSGISEEDRQVLMQFLPQLEHLKGDEKAKDFAKKDSFSNIGPQPSSTNGYADKEPFPATQPQPPSPNAYAGKEPSSVTQPQPPSTDANADKEPFSATQTQPLPTTAYADKEPSSVTQPHPPSTNGLADQEPSPETKPLPHIGHLTEHEGSPEENPQPPSFNTKQEHKSEESAKLDEIMKQLRSIRRQQTITHCLVSALIVVTAAWQFSEASILLSVKDKISHPFRAIGGFFSRALLGGEKMHILDNMHSPDIPTLEVPQLSHMKLPELPHPPVDFPSVVIDSIED